MSTPGERIREMRIRNKLTLDDVAKKLNVNRQAVYKYEHGVVTNIPLENLEIMAEMFGTTPGYLAGWDDDHPPELPPAVQPIVATTEARIISGGIDKMPPEKREQALRILQSVFVEYSDFFKENEK